jgi:hypothetical protein
MITREELEKWVEDLARYPSGGPRGDVRRGAKEMLDLLWPVVEAAIEWDRQFNRFTQDRYRAELAALEKLVSDDKRTAREKTGGRHG